MNYTQDVSLSLIDIPGSFREHTMGSVDSLAQDIQRNGQLQEIVVTPKEEGRYELVAGKRRTLAMRHLNWQNARAQVMENLSELQKALIMIAENDERVDVNPFDRALSFQRALNAGIAQTELANRLGTSEKVVSDVLGWLKFSPELTEDLRRRKFSGAKLTELARLRDTQSQLKMAEACDKQGWSSKALRDKVSRALSGDAHTVSAEPATAPASDAPFQVTRKSKGLMVRSREVPSLDDLDFYMHELRVAIVEFIAAEQHQTRTRDQEANMAKAA